MASPKITRCVYAGGDSECLLAPLALGKGNSRRPVMQARGTARVKYSNPLKPRQRRHSAVREKRTAAPGACVARRVRQKAQWQSWLSLARKKKYVTLCHSRASLCGLEVWRFIASPPLDVA